MTDIVSQRRIARPIDAVYSAAKQAERFAAVLPDVDKVTVLEDDGQGTVVTKWEGTVSLGPLTRRITWTERDVWDDAGRRCDFKLIEGDMKRFDGSWDFSPGADSDGAAHTDVTLKVDFELGIPVLGPMVNKIVDQLMQKNCDQLVEALEKLSA